MMQSWIQRLVTEAAIRLAPNNQHPTGSLQIGMAWEGFLPLMDARFPEMDARFGEIDARFSEMRISANLGKSRQISGNLGKSHSGEFSQLQIRPRTTDH